MVAQVSIIAGEHVLRLLSDKTTEWIVLQPAQ